MGRAFGAPGADAQHVCGLLRCLTEGLALERGKSVTLEFDD